jgi:hypothetical protein
MALRLGDDGSCRQEGTAAEEERRQKRWTRGDGSGNVEISLSVHAYE